MRAFFWGLLFSSWRVAFACLWAIVYGCFGASAAASPCGATFRSSLFARPCGLTALVCGFAALLHIARPLIFSPCFKRLFSAVLQLAICPNQFFWTNCRPANSLKQFLRTDLFAQDRAGVAPEASALIHLALALRRRCLH